MIQFNIKLDNFYCLQITDIQTNRDDKISQLFGEETTIWYLGADNIKYTEIFLARFWKSKSAAESTIRKISRIGSTPKNEIIFKILEFNREEFLKLMPDDSDIRWVNNYVSLRNKELRNKERNYLKKEKAFRGQYKATDAYKYPKDWYYWKPCRNCGLKPLVWEFNNGLSTACGCGRNEYDHFSIHSESIMSYVKRNNGSALGYNNDSLRMNWNQWVETGEILFDIKKEVDSGKW
jgi:hypothetical protein